MKTIRCQDCLSEFSDDEVKGLTACPSCKTTRLPISISHDIMLPINWHELRCLTIWASNWIDSSDDPATDTVRDWLQKLLQRISGFRPEGGGALTIAQEIKECQKEFPSISLLNSKGEFIIPPKEEA
jgi:hypothetical protein